jgi:lycopene cyclase domain-containing protein
MKKYYYLSSLTLVYIIPLLIESFLVEDVNLAALVLFAFGICIIGSMWDIWATRHGTRDTVWIWQFNKQNTLGKTLFDQPVEEYLFYISASLYIIFTWELTEQSLVTEDFRLLIIIALVLAWSLFFTILPFFLRSKNDAI